ncbi:MAG: ABC transporter substrate-binding protein [Desulforhopalus sp.]
MIKKMASALFFIVFAFAMIPAKSGAGTMEIEKLYEAAKAEGEVVWHVFGPAGPWESVAKAFEEKYPGIDVKPFGHSVSRMPARLITEAQAGKLTVDVPSANPMYILPLLERDMLLKEDWGKIVPDLNPEVVLMDGYFLNETDDPLIWVYNTNLVKEDEVPKSWEDLLDPRWKGHQISVRAMAGQLIGLYPKWKENPDEVIAFLKKLNAQELQSAANLGEAFRRVATGECKVGIFRSNSYLKMKSDGAPIAIAPIGPAVTTPTGNILLKGAAHPNAARLLLSYLHSPEGAAVAAEAVKIGVITGPKSTPTAELLTSAGMKFERIANTLEECEDYMAFEKAANEAMGWGKK